MADSIVTITPAALPRQPGSSPLDDSLLAQPSAILLFDDWYPALRSEQLRGTSMVTTTLLGIPMVLGRKNDGTVFAMRDSCPHRGIPLSCGWFDGNKVVCKYHGWAFEAGTGQCKDIPSLTSSDTLDPGKIYAGAFPCVERDGYAWVYVPSSGRGRIRADDALTAGTGDSQIRRPVSQRAPDRRPALQRRPWHHRPDGSGTWPLRSPVLVVAQQALHPRESQELRADS